MNDTTTKHHVYYARSLAPMILHAPSCITDYNELTEFFTRCLSAIYGEPTTCEGHCPQYL